MLCLRGTLPALVQHQRKAADGCAEQQNGWQDDHEQNPGGKRVAAAGWWRDQRLAVFITRVELDVRRGIGELESAADAVVGEVQQA